MNHHGLNWVNHFGAANTQIHSSHIGTVFSPLQSVSSLMSSVSPLCPGEARVVVLVSLTQTCAWPYGQ